MASYFLPKAFMTLDKNSFCIAPITVNVEKCCEFMGISKSTFYRRQEQRLKAQARIQAGDTSLELQEALSFPELLSDGVGSRTFVRYADIISWAQRLKGRAQS